MATEKRLIDMDYTMDKLRVYADRKHAAGHNEIANGILKAVSYIRNDLVRVDAVEVVNGYHPGDVCFYGFAPWNKSLALVEIVKILDNSRGCAEIRFLKVFVDDTGNGMFSYLHRTAQTMNASFKYLKNITPESARTEGDGDG